MNNILNIAHCYHNGGKPTKALVVLVIFAGVFHVCTSQILTNSFHVQFEHELDKSEADAIADRNGYSNMGTVRANSKL